MLPQRIASWCLVGLLALVVTADGSSVLAQRNFGNRGFGNRSGGFGRGSGGVLGSLRRDSVQSELDITDEQREQIDALNEEQREGYAELQPFIDRMRQAESDEQRDAIRAEMEQVRDKQREQAEAKLQKILSGKQFARAKQLTLQSTGLRGLLTTEISTELKITDDQRGQLEEVLSEFDQARRGLGFRASQEDREALNKEWEPKVLAVLTSTQRQAWTEKLGPPPVPVDSDEDRTADSNSRDSDTRDSADNEPKQSRLPFTFDEAPEGEEVVASFDPADQPQDQPAAVDYGAEADEEPPGSVNGATDDNTAATDDANSGDGAASPMTGQMMSFNFRYAPWEMVIKEFADAAGLVPDLSVTPPGTFNYIDDGHYTPEKALDILNGFLLQRGYLMVRRDRFLVIINIDDGIPPNLIPTVTPAELSKRGDNELLRMVLPTPGVDPNEAAQDVEPLLGPQGKVVPQVVPQSLVLMDTGSNLRMIHKLLSNVTATGDPEQVSFQKYPLQHIAAGDAEDTVRNLFGIESGVQSVGGYSSSRYSRDSRDSRDPRYSRDSRSSSSSNSSSGGSSTVFVTSDARTNTLLVKGVPNELQIIAQVVESIDVPDNQAVNPLANRYEGPTFKVYKLNDAEADEVLKTINAIFDVDVAVNEDGRNDKIHIYATEDEHRLIEDMIRKMDSASGGLQTVSVVPVTGGLDPIAAMTTIRSLFASDGDGAPSIEADVYGRQLIVRGSPDQILQVRTLISDLRSGEGYDSTARYGSGSVRTVPLGGRDPEEFLSLLEKIWESSTPQPIRVVIPKQPNPIRARRTLNGDEESSEPPADTRLENQPVRPDGFQPTRSEETRPRRPADDDVPTKPISFNDRDDETESAETVAEDDADSTEESVAETTSPAESKPPVAVMLNGGELILTSSDHEALTRMEELIDTLGQMVPPRTTWTVFYLRAADATETATLLEQLFPDSTVSSSTIGNGSLVSSFSSGISSFSNDLMDMTGLSSLGETSETLRIIPEIRTNSLFVSGPVHKVQQLEDVLQVLDADELPESLRDRVPRPIKVRYAEIDDVATIVKDVYEDYMEPPQQFRGGGGRDGGSRGGQNMFAMLMQGNGGGGGGARNQGIRLTVGVDYNTSQLIVSCSDSIYRQIEDLVRTLDDSALEARRTIQVITLDEVDATLVQTAVGTLMPKVTVSSTGSSRRPTTSSSSNGSSSRGGDSDDIQRRMEFIQRMQQFRQQQGGGNSGGGRPTFGGGGDRTGFGGGGDGSSSRGRFGGGDGNSFRGRFGGGGDGGGGRFGGGRGR